MRDPGPGLSTRSDLLSASRLQHQRRVSPKPKCSTLHSSASHGTAPLRSATSFLARSTGPQVRIGRVAHWALMYLLVSRNPRLRVKLVLEQNRVGLLRTHGAASTPELRLRVGRGLLPVVGVLPSLSRSSLVPASRKIPIIQELTFSCSKHASMTGARVVALASSAGRAKSPAGSRRPFPN